MHVEPTAGQLKKPETEPVKQMADNSFSTLNLIFNMKIDL